MFIRSRLKGLEIMLVESKPKEDRTVIQQYFGRILLFYLFMVVIFNMEVSKMGVPQVTMGFNPKWSMTTVWFPYGDGSQGDENSQRAYIEYSHHLPRALKSSTDHDHHHHHQQHHWYDHRRLLTESKQIAATCTVPAILLEQTGPTESSQIAAKCTYPAPP